MHLYNLLLLSVMFYSFQCTNIAHLKLIYNKSLSFMVLTMAMRSQFQFQIIHCYYVEMQLMF